MDVTADRASATCQATVSSRSAIADEIVSDRYESIGTPVVSVVVATRGRSGFLPGLFVALDHQDFPGPFDVIVVDDASSDATWPTLCSIARETDLALLGLRVGENIGQGAARTKGVIESRAPLVAVTDDDCLPTPSWLSELCRPYGIFSPSPPSVDGTSSDAMPSMVVQGRTEGHREDAMAGPWSRTLWVLGPTWLFETCNIAYRREDLVAVGCFGSGGDVLADPRGKVVGEDTRTGWAVHGRGATLVYSREALVHHRRLPATYRQWLIEQRGKQVFPALAAGEPRMKRALLFGVFLSRHTAVFDLALIAFFAAALSSRVLIAAGMVPWMVDSAREVRDRFGSVRPGRIAQVAVGDLVGLTSLLVGSIRHRRLVL